MTCRVTADKDMKVPLFYNYENNIQKTDLSRFPWSKSGNHLLGHRDNDNVTQRTRQEYRVERFSVPVDRL